ncbi:MAG: phage major capsid protein [Beijerinckiaceae bacterium]|nr:phage major capsid protein [Beijerinckiaceae bacterium]
MHNQSPPVEIKSTDPANTLGDLHRAFAAFREANDERMAQIETRLSSDVVTEEKLTRIDRALDETRRRLDSQIVGKARPRLSGAGVNEDADRNEHKGAFRSYMRSGDSAGLKAMEEKAMSAGSGPDGGFLVPQPAEREILQRLANISPIRAIASVREISTATFRKAFPVGAPVAGWAGEADPRAQTTSPQLADMSFPAMELFAMPAATQTLLDDAAVDVEQWLAEEIDTVFAEQEGSAFVTGDGVNKPTGFLSYPVSTHAAWSWGKLGYTATGAAGAFAASNPSDQIIDLIYALRAGYRQNARFVMNRKTQSAIRKLKSSGGDYLWQPPASAGQDASLMGFPLTEAENMPDIGADARAIAFGDFRRGYLVVDRLGVRVLRDPYSAKPYVLFYTTKRVGGGVQDFDAIKLMKFGAS